MDNGLIRIPVLPSQTRTAKARAALVILTFCILGGCRNHIFASPSPSVLHFSILNKDTGIFVIVFQ